MSRLQASTCAASVLVTAALLGCAEPEPAPGTSAAASTTQQGSGYQGSGYQGSGYQGSGYQGSRYRATSVKGARRGAVAAVDVRVTDTVLEVWTPEPRWPFRLQQRLPDRLCTWDPTGTSLVGCTDVDLEVAPSPLAGVTFTASFRREDGSTFSGQVRIGRGTATVGAVAPDTSLAMHPLAGNVAAQGCTLDHRTSRCEDPDGCRKNCDLWLYQLELADAVDEDGEPLAFCPGGLPALALAGVYELDGTLKSSTAEITFACTNGTIAKCTRWGYRPFGKAAKRCVDSSTCDGAGLTAMRPYHEACVRAAAADYCANGHSFTQDGTLVDIFDFRRRGSAAGLIMRAGGQAFVAESSFDRKGAVWIDHLRYQELHRADFDDPDVGCPDAFDYYPGDDDVQSTWRRLEPEVPPYVQINSSTACAHSELTVGKWLHVDCNPACIAGAPEACRDPEHGWDAACVAYATRTCKAPVVPMTPHSECKVGGALARTATGCTLRVCATQPGCCGADGGTWTSACVAAADQLCRGGQEVPPPGAQGFCGAPVIIAPSLPGVSIAR